MPNVRHPRRGSLQYWPRKRAKKAYARVRTWKNLAGNKLLGFVGYKAGMTHVMVRDNAPIARVKNQSISIPVTVIECPPLKVLSIRFYKQDENKDMKLISETFSKNIHKNVKRKTKISKKVKEEPKEFDDIKLVVHTQPWLAGINKKKPEIMELGISGKPEEKLTLAKDLLEKEIKVKDIFKELQFIDTRSISKGKGFQGPVKRFGVKLLPHKSEKKKRGPGTLGPWHPHKISFRIAMAGQMGYNQRTELNKVILKINNKPEEVNPKGGFLHYGLVKNEYLLLKGSVPGTIKRAIILTEPTRQRKSPQYELQSVSISSKQ